ncbi:hypothetical protein AMTRI_Chr02g223480 [Amborella trichopoda]
MIRVIRNLCPDIVVLTKVEGKHNSPPFVNRFIEVLLYYSAYFDSLDAFMEAVDPSRLEIERVLMGSAIPNMVVGEGGERIIRHIGIDTWRLLMNRVGLEEIYPHSESISLEMNGKALTVGWKGGIALCFCLGVLLGV